MDDNIVFLALIAGVFLFFGGLIGAAVHSDNLNHECRTVAINKGMPALEIQGVCK